MIALAAAIFLIYSNLDNIPDCPELLASASGTSALVNSVHYASPTLNGVCVASGIVPSPTFGNHFAADVQPITSPCCVTRSLHQAADPSPPSA
jgi:hypothetical protein